MERAHPRRIVTKPTGHLDALDGLRAIAVSLVVWYHLWQITWLAPTVHLGFTVIDFSVFPETGSAGVDLFYFISGFCLFYPYARTLFDGAPMQSVRTFAYRRVIKIVPSYYLAIALMIAVGWANFHSQRDALGQVVAHVFFVQNLWPDTWGGIDGVMWSLATEVQFYLVFPLVCYCAMRRPLATFGTLVIFADVYRFAIRQSGDALYALDRLPGAIDLFAAGMFTAWAYRSIAVRRPRLAGDRGAWLAVSAVGLLATYTLLAYEFAHRYDAQWLVVWKVSFRPFFDLTMVAITLGSLFTFRSWQRALGNPAFVFLSAISYNLYLWHQPLARFLATSVVLPPAGTDAHTDHRYGLAFTIVALGSSIMVAWLLTRYVEMPILRRRPLSNFTRPRLTRPKTGNAS